jgi:hypothetical protein
MRKGALMGSRKPLPQTAPERGLLARLTQDILGNSTGQKLTGPVTHWKAKAGATPKASLSTRQQLTASKPWLMESVSWGGIGLSAVLAGVGVCGLVGFESPLAKVGSGILLGGTILTEIAAARLPVHAQKRFGEGGWFKGSIALFGFAGLTAWNVICGHMGMAAIDHAALQDRRAPLERAAAESDAAREVAEEALTEFDAETRRQSEQMGVALRGAFESGYVTAAARNARESSDARAERRVSLAQAVTDARGADRAAERALAAAPSPRPDHELWFFAAILELCKGLLTWFATASERRARTTIISGPSSEAQKLIDPRSLCPSDRRALKTYCASVLATIRHMEAARA